MSTVVRTADAFNLGNYSTEYGSTGFKIANYSSEYGSTGFKAANFTSNFATHNATSGQWNVSSTAIFLRELAKNVGIGIAAPTFKLHVIGDTNITGSLIVGGQNITANTNVSTLYGFNGTTNVPVAVTADGALRFSVVEEGGTNLLKAGTVGTDLTLTGDLTIDTTTLYVSTSNDRVGVGTISPGEKLHVVGNLNITGTINGINLTQTINGTLVLAPNSTLQTSGGNSITLTSTGTTNVTLPVTGTLAVTPTYARMSYTGGNFETTSGTLVNVTGANLSIVTRAIPILCGFTGNVITPNSWAAEAAFNLMVDGSPLLGTSGVYITTPSLDDGVSDSSDYPLVLTAMTSPLSAGYHNVTLAMMVNGGVQTFTVRGTASQPMHMWCYEVG